jgi:hypothetical protein
LPDILSNGNATGEALAIESAEGTESESERLEGAMYSPHKATLTARFTRQTRPKVDAGARNWMLRVIGDAAVWSIVSKRTVIKLGVGLTGRAGSRQVATSA